MNQIILIGFMGSGKTSVGIPLAAALGIDFVDMDAQIVQQEGLSINEIFAQHGETYFRKLETQLLEKLSQGDQRVVISTGGGVPIQPQNRCFLKDNNTVVYLKASTDILVERLQKDDSRPILQGGDLRKKIIDLQTERNPIYEQVCDEVVVTDQKTIAEIVAEIQKIAVK